MAELIIVFILSNFTLSFFVLGLIFALISIYFQKQLTKNIIIEAIFSYFLLFSVGLSYFYNFVMHCFFGEMAAKFIGWAQSPFQFEVGVASLGVAICGIFAFRASWPFRAATIIVPVVFSLGAAAGHVYQMVVNNNFAPGNAGIMFWTDIIFPILALILLGLSHKYPRALI